MKTDKIQTQVTKKYFDIWTKCTAYTSPLHHYIQIFFHHKEDCHDFEIYVENELLLKYPEFRTNKKHARKLYMESLNARS